MIRLFIVNGANGKVINVAGEGAGMKLTIEFPTQGVRVVMAKFAPVKRDKTCVWQLTSLHYLLERIECYCTVKRM